MASDPEPLCNYCAQVPLTTSALATSRQSSWSLGPGSRLKNSHCTLCRLVFRTFLEDHRTGPSYVANNNWPDGIDDIVLQWRPNSGPGNRGVFGINKGGDQSICFVRSDGGTDDTTVEGEYLLPSTQSVLDVKRVGRWMASCDTLHAGECVPDTSNVTFGEAFPGLRVMRFLDVERNCLFESDQTQRYAALSYMWGKATNFRLLTANRDDLRQAGGLEKYWQLIPWTIRDAIVLCRKLRIQYLWVDALCLIQDDYDDLDRGVNVMDMVYERSWLTIIAACGNDANAGLPGVRDRTREPVELSVQVKPGVSLGLITGADQLIRKSVYDSRAWTYQEAVLARRSLYFVDNKVMFRCRGAEYLESCLDHPKPRAPTSNLGSMISIAVDMTDLADFGLLLLYYTTRELTNQNDALRAMAGIMRRFSEHLRYPFFEGLPSAAVDGFILFTPSRGNLSRRPGFPSYSWTGWRGGVDVQLELEVAGSHLSLNEWLAERTWIIWYTRDPVTGQIEPVWNPAVSGSSDPDSAEYFEGYQERRLFQPATPLDLDTACSVPTNSLRSEIPSGISYPLLQFWTMSVFFRLGAPVNRTGTAKASLLGSDSTECGGVFLDGFHGSSFFGDQSHYELLVLSESRTDVIKHQFFDTWDFYNVILIEWNMGVAERRGCGSLRKAALGQSFAPGPVWNEIVLG